MKRRNTEKVINEKMKNIEKKPQLPTVTVEEFLAYNPADPSTKTSSPIVNAVKEAMDELRPMTGVLVAERLDLDFKKLSAALEIITGHSFATLRYYWLEQELARNEREHPEWNNDQRAQAVGLYNRASLFRLLKSPDYKAKKRLNINKGWYHH